MNGWEEFSKNFLEIAGEIAFKDIENHGEELGEVALNRLFDREGPTSMDREITKNEEYYGIILTGFSEIMDSFDILKDIPVYIRSFPYRNKRIEKPRFLKYHVENYFNEVYILKERMIAFLKKIKRCFRRDEKQREVYKKTEPLFTVINKSFKNIVDVRGSHVHERRFSHKDLNRLTSLKIHSQFDDGETSKMLKNYYDYSYRQIRKEWKNKLKDNNEVIGEILSLYGEVLNDILLNNSKDDLIYPSSYAG